MNERSVVELTFKTTHAASEIVAFWLQEAGALGVTIVDPEEIRADLARPDSLDYAGADFLDALPETVEIAAWFYHADDDLFVRDGSWLEAAAPLQRKSARHFIDGLKPRLTSLHASDPAAHGQDLGYVGMKIVRQEAWEHEWKRYVQPLFLGERLVVAPSWQENPDFKRDKVVVYLDPGMAFGSGSHETTAQCAALLERHVKPGDRVLDVGTGSGLLAIFAKKLGAATTVAIDVDPMAVRTAAENAAANEVAIDARTTTLDQVTGSFDVVVANIVFNVLVSLKEELARVTKRNGILLCSGILAERVDEFTQIFAEAGFDRVAVQEERDWAALTFRRYVS